MIRLCYVAVGGAIGCILRYLSVQAFPATIGNGFPVGTFTVNMIGSLLIGILFGIFSLHGEVDEKIRLLLFTGFLGGFTTFSAFSLENVKLMQAGQVFTAALYSIVSVVLGISLTFAGYYLAVRLK